MSPRQALAIRFIAVIASVTATFSTGLLAGAHLNGGAFEFQSRSRGESLDLIREAYYKILGSAVEAPGDKELAHAAIKGMIRALARQDPYATYLPQGSTSLQELATGKFAGIGISLKVKADGLTVVSVIEDTPALAAGLRIGDRIISIDGKPVDTMTVDRAAGSIKGPAGTEVQLEVRRDEELIEFVITREMIDLPQFESSLNGDIGYIRLFQFAKGAGDKVREEVDRLIDEGAEGLVFDLRGNTGGLFSEAVEVASVFIEDGVLVTYKQKAGPEVDYEAKGDAFEEIPMVVLVNQGSASAAEIVAGAIQDRGRAVLVGMRTYGKAAVQEVVALDDKSELKLTIASYVTPDGTDITGKGIAPDIQVRAPGAQRRRAVEILRGLVYSGTTRS